ncbi:MarR family winged helix-turn-helix transcriptional regulator [Flammeovirga sp. EKP202]|uniref:MarR family winged helix-turn-helix transcriptional regulator n=1 Tax=Flammeovirga sp. EKP202 TaxID=2770592 RepID=UPI00165ED6A6|nr:helix-turn-helix domain-containing protein [Flammeovirga sp. EKP202]MBD0401010.1 MarR family transcriptional regulator [Flammeovirga sp. EKP202]
MDFYQSAGTLVLGSRLRRLGERFLSEVSKVYEAKGIEFDPSWFPVFYLLDEHKKLSMRDISDQLNVSHSAVSQLTTALIKKKLLKVEKDENDGRKRLILFTEKGDELVKKSKPIWASIQLSMKEITEQNECQILKELKILETSLTEKSLSERVMDNLEK